jgi:hypothetical protein
LESIIFNESTKKIIAMKLSIKISLFCLLFLILSSCTAQPQDIEACVQGETVGFLHGLWHGFISPVTFILSLFIDSIDVFATNNNGGWYIFGFLLGVGAFTSGSAKGAQKSRKKC